MFRPLFIAFQLMSRIPVPSVITANEQDYGRSVVFYPLVGLVIGALLYGLLYLFEVIQIENINFLLAAIVLSVWVGLTGAIHLDGLADSADAWLGGFGDRKRTLEIMKDPYAGPAAIVVLVLMLLIKFSALGYLVVNNFLSLLFIPVWARISVMVLFLTTPYVRKQGIATQHMAGLPRKTAWFVIVLVWLASIFLVKVLAIIGLLISLTGFILTRYLMVKRIGGMTGDTAGALIEISEVLLLVGVVVYNSLFLL
jgi:adenosylcobinamide-GDP ribazoletransferase